MHTDNKQLASLLFTHDPSQSRKERGRGGHKAERGGAFVMDMNLLSVIFAVKLGNISFRPAGTLCRGGWRFLLYDCRNSETITPHLSEIGHAEEWGAAHLWPLGGKERGRDRGQFNFLTFPPKQSFLCKSKEYFSPPWDFYKQKTKREKAGGGGGKLWEKRRRRTGSGIQSKLRRELKPDFCSWFCSRSRSRFSCRGRPFWGLTCRWHQSTVSSFLSRVTQKGKIIQDVNINPAARRCRAWKHFLGKRGNLLSVTWKKHKWPRRANTERKNILRKLLKPLKTNRVYTLFRISGSTFASNLLHLLGEFNAFIFCHIFTLRSESWDDTDLAVE